MWGYAPKAGTARKTHTTLVCWCAATAFALVAVLLIACAFALPAFAQSGRAPVVIQPGAPGEESKVLPPDTRPQLPPVSAAEIAFMQGMIMHHQQALDMTELIPSHSQNQEIRLLGARIYRSQADEIKFMQDWLALRGAQPSIHAMHGHAMHLMPGMLTPEQMQALRDARGEQFDRLFLQGMIQHHGGALTMVDELFDTAGAGQTPDLFMFASDVDNGQRAEIKIMQSLLEKAKERP